jgi:hypothetical protein
MAPPIEATERIVTSMGWSIFVYLCLIIIPDFIFSLEFFAEKVAGNIASPEKLLFTPFFLRSYFFILIFAFLLGIAISKFAPSRALRIMTGRNRYARVWDDFFRQKGVQAADNGLWIEMKDKTVWVGKLVSASDSPGEHELWLTDVRKFENDELKEMVFTDMLVHYDEVERIFVLDDTLVLHSNIQTDMLKADNMAAATKSKE